MSGLYSTLISPSVAILNKLKFTWKFALIFSLYLIPVVYVAFILLTEHTKGIDIADLERDGLKYMVGLRPLFEHMAQTRGMTNAYLNGKSELLQKINTKRSVVNNELDTLINIDAQLSNVLDIGGLAKAIQDDWGNVTKNAFSMEPAKAFAAHTAVIEKIVALKGLVLENSKLLLDPSFDSNFMGNALSIRIPMLAENMGKARGLGAEIVAAGSFSPDSYLKLTSFINKITHANDSMRHGFDVVFENNAELNQELFTLRKSANDATNKFIALTKNKVLDSVSIEINSADYFTRGTEAISANLKLSGAVMSVLDNIYLYVEVS